MSVPSSKVTTTCDRPNFEMDRTALEPGQTAQHLLDGEGDLLLDLLRAEARGDGVDLHLNRRRVGESINVQVPHRHRPEDGEGRRRQDHEQSGCAAKSR